MVTLEIAINYKRSESWLMASGNTIRVTRSFYVFVHSLLVHRCKERTRSAFAS